METYNVHNLETKVRFLLPHPGGHMVEYDFDETYMKLTKKALVKMLKRKTNELVSVTEKWKYEKSQNESLMALLDDYNDKLENGCCKK